MRAGATSCAANSCRRNSRRSFSHITEMPMKWGFLRRRTAVALRIVVAHTTRSQTRVQAKRCFLRRPPCDEKNCAPKALSGRSTGQLSAQNERISGQPIRENRRRRRLPRLFPHAARALQAPRLGPCEKAARSRPQPPMRFFRSSLTVCGFALPPDAFITWPTNHPIAFGLALASATLSGFGDNFLDELLQTANVADLLEPALLDPAI